LSHFKVISEEDSLDGIQLCKECGGKVIVLSHELVCSSCGLVQSCIDVLEVPPNGVFTEGSRFIGYSPSFVGGPGSEILNDGIALKDGKSQVILPQREEFYLRLRNSASKMRSRSGSSELRTSRLIWSVSELLHLPKPVTESAVLAYRRSAPKISGSGIRHAALAACCLIYVAREFSNATTLSMKEVLKAFARRGVELRTRDILKAGFLVESGRAICKSEDYLYRILDRLVSSLDNRILRRCGCEDRFQLLQKLFFLSKKLLEGIGPDARGGRNPILLASAVVYASTRLLSPTSVKSPISQRIVALASGTLEYSVRETYEDIKDSLRSLEENLLNLLKANGA